MPDTSEAIRTAIREAAVERARLHEHLKSMPPGARPAPLAEAYAKSRGFIDRITGAEALAALRAGAPAALEYAVCFLEEHPFCPDSGFALRDIARTLKHVRIPPPHAARIRAALLDLAALPARDEMKHLRQLALTVADEEFLHALDALADAAEGPGRENATALATYLTKHWESPPWAAHP